MDFLRCVFEVFLDLLDDCGFVFDDEDGGGIENGFGFLRIFGEGFEVDDVIVFFDEDFFFEGFYDVVVYVDFGDFEDVVVVVFSGEYDDWDVFEGGIGF